MRFLTDFILFKNTPLVNFQNTILFESNEERDRFFIDEGNFQPLPFFNQRFNFIRDRQTIDLPIGYGGLMGYNYCTFISDFEPDTRYYAYIISIEYINNNTTRVNLLVDGIMTFCQGNFLETLKNIKVNRTHLSRGEYNRRLWELRNNDDVLKTFSKRYFNEEKVIFDEFDVLIQSSADLSADFGDIDNPKIETSEGLVYDKISAPLNLYVVKQIHFRELMKKLAPYPWIGQNFQSIVLIPSELLKDRYDPVTMQTIDFDKLYELRDGDGTFPFIDDALKPLNKTMDELYQLFDLDKDMKHLLRNEYTTTEFYTYDGQALYVDNGLLNDKVGIELNSETVSGFYNEIALYLRGYKSENEGRQEGAFLNDAIFIRNFDKIPTLIDTQKLAIASTANQRELAESRLASNRLGSVFGQGDNSPRQRFHDAASLMSNISVSNLFGKFTDEYNFYQNQLAEQKDLAIGLNTITQQTNENSLAIANDFLGIHMKMSKPQSEEMNKLKKYYRMFGHLIDEENYPLNMFTHTICQYVQFSGNWSIPNADVAIVEMVRAQFENGVRFWHANDTVNPLDQNPIFNTFRS